MTMSQNKKDLINNTKKKNQIVILFLKRNNIKK